MSNVLILVLSCDNPPYPLLIQTIRDTWGKNPSCPVYYNYGHRPNCIPPTGTVIQNKDEIICGQPEGLENILIKTLLAYKYIINNPIFDHINYVFRCCCGSYVVPTELEKFLINKPKERFYCGIVGDCNGIKFASGSGYFISRDLIKLVVNNFAEVLKYNEPAQDDVSIGRFLNTIHKIPINPSAKRIDLDDNNITTLPGNYHYHFRHRPDHMLKIHKLLGNR